MKKTKFLIAVMVCAIMLMGVGYAWWNETLTVTETVNAGKLDVNFVTAPCGLSPLAYVKDNKSGCWPTPYASGVCNINSDGTLSVTYSNMYPGSRGILHFRVKNESTMPVVLRGAWIEGPWGDSLKDYLSLSGDVAKVASNGFTLLTPKVHFFNKSFSEAGAAIVGAASGMVLQPGEFMIFGDGDSEGEDECIIVKVDGSAPNETMEDTVTFKIKLDFGQYNEVV